MGLDEGNGIRQQNTEGLTFRYSGKGGGKETTLGCTEWTKKHVYIKKSLHVKVRSNIGKGIMQHKGREHHRNNIWGYLLCQVIPRNSI